MVESTAALHRLSHHLGATGEIMREWLKHCDLSVKAGLALGQQLRALALKQMATAARTHKHTSVAQRPAIAEYDWWFGLLESVGLDAPATPLHGR